MRLFLHTIGPIPFSLAVMVWWVILFRTLGGVDADYGNFITVAERLLSGDRLYIDVYENKDPLFHYLNALSRWITPWGSWLLGTALVALSGVAVWHIFRSQGLGVRASFVLGGIASPIIITGSAYFPGSSHLLGVATTLVAMAFASRQHWVWSGVTVGLVFGLKLVMAPVAIAAVLVVALHHRSTRGVALACLGAVASLGGLVGILAFRGELIPYFANLVSNAQYSNDASGGLEGLSGLLGHLVRVLDANNLTAVAVAVLFLALSVALTRGERSSDRNARRSIVLVIASASTLLVGLGVLAVTGLWGHHALILAPAFILALGAFVIAAPDSLRILSPVALPFVVIAAGLLAAMPTPFAYADSFLYARGNLDAHVNPGPEARAILGSGPATTYARVGNARDEGHALGLREWELACPKFAEEVWESEASLAPKLECLPSANVILITADVVEDLNYPDWSAYVSQVREITSVDYDCIETEVGTVCRRKGT